MLGKMGELGVELSGFIDVSAVLQGGVYVLVHRGEIVYIGKAKRMLNRVYAHLSIASAKAKRTVPSWLPIAGVYYDAIFIRPCHPDHVDALEREMIDLYRPRHNDRLKPTGPIKAPFSIRVGDVSFPFNTHRPSGLPEITRRL